MRVGYPRSMDEAAPPGRAIPSAASRPAARWALSALQALLLLAAPSFAAAQTTIELVPERVLQYDPPLGGDTAIQTFDSGPGLDLYFTQRVGRDTHLSRCTRTADDTCVQQDTVVLPDFGHGESLEVFEMDGGIFAWVGSATTDDHPYWSQEISLIEYLPAPPGSTRASHRVVGTLTDLASVAPGYSGAGRRSAVAVADEDDRLALRIQVGPTGSSSYYGVYRTRELRQRLMDAPGGRLPISDASDLRVSQFREPYRPHGSFQGFDIRGVGSGNKYLYLFGGGGGDEAPTIYRFLYTNGGNTTHDRTYIIRGGYVGTLEAEGVKSEADPSLGGHLRVQLGLKATRTDADGRLQFRLYRFAENGEDSPPALPSAPTCASRDRVLTAHWSEPDDNGSSITEYEAKIRNRSTGETATESVGTAREASFTPDPEDRGIDHDWQIRARNAAGWSSWSPWSSTCAVPDPADAGTRAEDGGHSADAGTAPGDAGHSADAGTDADDAGLDPSMSGHGCACRAGTHGGSPARGWLVLILLGLACRRRRSS